jgi:hypothetical protein
MTVRCCFAVVLAFGGTVVGLTLGQQSVVNGEDSVTTLGNRKIKYTVPEAGYHVLRRGDVTAVVVDNGAVDDATLKGHRAGYSGVASLTHKQRADNLFVPSYAGLNYEHIHDGTTQHRDVLFEPRRAPMELRVINEHTVELYQAPTPTWKLESVLKYEMLADGTIEMTLECIPRAKTFRNGYVGLFWASYIHQPESLDIHFRGTTGRDDKEPGWIRGVTPSHGILSTHISKQDTRKFTHDEDFPLTLAFNRSKHLFSEPWYYAVSHDMAFVQLFRPQDEIRLTQSPSGGGNGNPAWDFQWFVPDYEVGRLYRMVMRAQYVPFESPEQIQRVSRVHRTALGQPVSDQEKKQAVLQLQKVGVELSRIAGGDVNGVSFSKRNANRKNVELLAALPDLTTLRLYETDATDEIVRLLRPLTRLQSLDLGFCQRITDASVDGIVRLRELQFLNLGFCRRVTGKGFSQLGRLRQLRVLNMSVTSLTDADLSKLTELKNLTSLDIDNTRVTDAGVDSLLKLPRLRSLRMVGVQISDAGLSRLASKSNLRHINLRDVPVSEEAIAGFRAARPQCLVKL